MKKASEPQKTVQAEVAHRNEDARVRRIYEDNTTVCIGRRIVERDGDAVIFGFEELMVWDTRQKKHVHLHPTDPDKFKIIAEDYATASSEFWGRWRLFCQAKFNRAFIKIEAHN